jgi:hypothetical protein
MAADVPSSSPPESPLFSNGNGNKALDNATSELEPAVPDSTSQGLGLALPAPIDAVSTATSPAVAEASRRKGTAKAITRSNVRLRTLLCRACHIPYHRRATPFPMSTVKCGICRKRFVPEVLLTNIDLSSELDVVGEGYHIEAHLCRSKKRKEGESNAGIVSDALPFIEYDLHRQLLYKLRIQGLNAIFGLQIQLAISTKHCNIFLMIEAV